MFFQGDDIKNTQNEKKITLDNINKLRGLLGDDGLLSKIKANSVSLEKDVKGLKATLDAKIKAIAEAKAIELEKAKAEAAKSE